MRDKTNLFLIGILYAFFYFGVVGPIGLQAQSKPRSVGGKPAAIEELSQAELQETYRNMREQLRATQMTIANNRYEAEANARAQAAAIADKLAAMNALLETERKSRQEENDRFEFERERQQAELQQSTRSVIWIASAFGSVALLAMLLAALFQWRAIHRMAEVVDQRALLPDSLREGLVGGPGEPFNNQLLPPSAAPLLSTLERMELRMKELEQATARPLATNSPKQSEILSS